MTFRLAPEAAAAGHRLVQHETIGSTNADAMAHLRSGDGGPLWVVSTHQTDGRGRRGSEWQTPPGNLATSLGLVLDAEPAMLATLGFVAGLALVRALDCCASRSAARSQDGADAAAHLPPAQASRSGLEAGSPFRLKWPNDVLGDGDKLAGILLETELLRRARAVVIGIGVNVEHAPEGVPYRVASLRTLRLDVTAQALFDALSSEWVRAYQVWDQGRGFAAIRDGWIARATGFGHPVSVRSGAEIATGTFETIDGQGRLVLRGPDAALRTISAGDVHFGDTASVRPEVAA